jgi:glycerate-2-kinase
VAAVDPAALVRAWLGDHPFETTGRILVVGAGKAAARMAAGCEAALGPARFHGLVIVPDECGVDLESIDVRFAGHPVPDGRGVAATAELCRRLDSAPGDAVLALVSGGASSLLVQPRAPLTLAEKVEVNRLLLSSGADIGEFNTVRKHLSAVKGGGLLRRSRGRRVLTLVLSDVVGNDPTIIGSGPTVPDPTTFGDALGIVRRYAIDDKIAPAALALLERGVRGEVEETVKPGESVVAGEVAIIGDNRRALSAAVDEAKRLGYEALLEARSLEGDTTVTARRWLRDIRGRVEGRRRCAVAGGETTVAVHGTGRGGRNQEFALALVELLDGAAMCVLSAGSDGVDGPTDAAGAFVDGRTAPRALTLGLDPAVALAANDSYGFFDRLGDLFRCGPTGTNVMDIKLAVGLPSTD